MYFELAHFDTCLPDYFGGHHLPHLQIPVNNTMTLEDLKRELHNELNTGCISGSQGWEVSESELMHFLAKQAIDKLTSKTDLPFSELEDDQDDDESVYAFFLLVPFNNLGEKVPL
jgi:hypothetical protein